MATIEDLMHANLFEVFGERDADTRMAAIRRTYADVVHFSDPDDAVTGHEALSAKARQPRLPWASIGPTGLARSRTRARRIGAEGGQRPA